MNEFEKQLAKASNDYDGKPYKEKGMTDEDRKRLRAMYSKEHIQKMIETINIGRSRKGDLRI